MYDDVDDDNDGDESSLMIIINNGWCTSLVAELSFMEINVYKQNAHYLPYRLQQHCYED